MLVNYGDRGLELQRPGLGEHAVEDNALLGAGALEDLAVRLLAESDVDAWMASWPLS
jgi:hypothetical protein